MGLVHDKSTTASDWIGMMSLLKQALKFIITFRCPKHFMYSLASAFITPNNISAIISILIDLSSAQ